MSYQLARASIVGSHDDLGLRRGVDYGAIVGRGFGDTSWWNVAATAVASLPFGVTGGLLLDEARRLWQGSGAAGPAPATAEVSGLVSSIITARGAGQISQEEATGLLSVVAKAFTPPPPDFLTKYGPALALGVGALIGVGVISRIVSKVL